MSDVEDCKVKLESADELEDSDLEWESADELDSTVESMPPMSSCEEMDEDIGHVFSDTDMSTGSGSSTNYETPNKKAKKSSVNSNGVEMNVSTDSGSSSCKKSNAKSKIADKVSDEIVGDHWNSEEKALLLASIKEYGMLNLTHLASILETKNVRQIKDFLTRVARSVASENKSDAMKRATRRLAKLQVCNRRGRMDRKKLAAAKREKFKELFAQEMGEGPIEWWLQYLEKTIVKVSKDTKKIDKTSNPRAVSEMIPRACQLIAQYEDHPHPNACSGVDYKEAYECLYHVLSGMPPKALSQPTAMFIQRSIDRLRNSILDGMYSPDYCKSFGEQVSHIQTASKVTRLPPKRTYGASSKKSGPVMTQGTGLPGPSQSMDGLMVAPGFNLMRVPETLTWRKGFAFVVEKPLVKQRNVIRKDIPFGLFCDTDIYEGVGPSMTTK